MVAGGGEPPPHTSAAADASAASLADLRALLGARRLDEAASYARALLERRPQDREARFLLGVALAEARRFQEARAEIEQALAAEAHPPWAKRLVLTNVLRDAGDARASEVEARRLLVLDPARPQVLNALGLALRDQGRPDEALAAFEAALAAHPGYVSAALNTAAVLQQQGRTERASSVLETAAATSPADPGVHLALARLRYGVGDIYTAIADYERAIAHGATHPDVLNRLGNAYMDVARHDQAARCYRAALDLAPSYAEVYDNLLVLKHYDPGVTPQEMYDAHVEWVRRFAPAVPPRRPARPSPGTVPVRLGFISPAFSRSATGFFLLPLVRHLDRRRFACTFYATSRHADDLTRELRSHAENWRDVAGSSDAELADAIEHDELDVLVELSGHTPGNRLRALARKPARVVLSWLDYFDTTALPAVDYLIGDEVSTPAATDQIFSEQVLRIEPSRLCYAPPHYAPAVQDPPCVRNGYVTFGSFNRLAKLADPVLDLWCRLLESVPHSRLLLKSAAFNHPRTQDVFAQRFETRGIGRDRLVLRPSSSHEELLRGYAEMDIALDPFPYNGGLTTCEALWMGVPVVALRGRTMISRQSAALLTAAGQARWIAASDTEWLAIARALASDVGALAAIRRTLRGAVEASALVDGAAFARKFGAMLQDVTAARA